MTTQVTQIAANATLESWKTRHADHVQSRRLNPYFAGIADAPCIKPDHIGGSQYHLAPYDRIVPWRSRSCRNPDIKVRWYDLSPPMASQLACLWRQKSNQQAARGVARLATVESRHRCHPLSDLNLATEALVNQAAWKRFINPDQFHRSCRGQPWLARHHDRWRI